MKSYKLGSQLDSQRDLGKKMALKFDAGVLKSKKYGEAKVQGSFLFINRYGKFPQVNVKQVVECINNWVRELGLEETYIDIYKTDIPNSIAHLSPNVDSKDLKLLFLSTLFEFLYDDAIGKFTHLNKGDPAICQETIQKSVKALISIVREKGDKDITEKEASTLDRTFKTSCMLLSEICRNTISKENTSYFINDLTNYVRSNKWVQENNSNNIFYEKDEYLYIRSFNAGVSPLLEAISLIKGITLSSEVRDHPLFQRYRNMVTMHVALSNDVLSLKKEIIDSEKENFVLVKCSKYSLQKSIYKAEKKVNNLIINIEKIGSKLKSYFPDDSNLENFVRNAEYFVDGFLYWYEHLPPRYGHIKFQRCSVEYEPSTFLENTYVNKESMRETFL